MTVLHLNRILFATAKIFACVAAVMIVAGCSVETVGTSSTPALSFLFKPESSQKLIVFVHGVFGDPSLTWTNRSGVSWPDLIKGDESFRDFAVAAYRYDTPLLGRTSGIEEIATRLLRQLEDEGVFRKYNEIYFIAHSMGGLVVKRVLVDLNRPGQLEKLRRVKAILYISTPAQGANISQLGSWLSINPQLRDMQPADLNSFLQTLENQWQDLIRDRGTTPFPQSFCAYETKRTRGIMVVNRVYAATRCDQNPFPVDENHTDIVKPASREADIYVWASARIQETSDLARGPRLEYFLRKTPYSNYEPGLTIQGIEWKENYREYDFTVRNPSKTERVVDLRLRFEFPWPVIYSRLYIRGGCEGSVVEDDDDNVKVGNAHVVRKVVHYRTNILQIYARSMFPASECQGKVILATGKSYSDHSNVQVSYRDGLGVTKKSFYYKISVLDVAAGTVKIEPIPLKGKQRGAILMHFDEPVQLSKPARVELSIPLYSVGIIYEETDKIHPIGTGFALEDTHYIITAWHVAFDPTTGEQRRLLFHPVGGTGQTPAFYLEAHQSFRERDIAVMKLEGISPAVEPLIRGKSELIRSGDFVAYGGFSWRENKPVFNVNANRIRRIFSERGIRFFEIQGIANSGYSGGPLFGGGKTVVGIILNVKPLDDKTSLFYAADVRNIPPLTSSTEVKKK